MKFQVWLEEDVDSRRFIETNGAVELSNIAEAFAEEDFYHNQEFWMYARRVVVAGPEGEKTFEVTVHISPIATAHEA